MSMIHRRSFLASVLATVGIDSASAFALSEHFPNRVVRLIVPFAPGGGVDVFARLLAESLNEKKGITVTIENRPGSNGTLGASLVQHSAPDGYSLLFSAATHVMARLAMPNVPFDPVTDFAPIARVGAAPMLLVMSPNLPPKTIVQLLMEARRQPQQWTFATSSLGSPGHIATIAFNKLAGLNLVIAAYRGTAPGVADVAAGHVQLMIDPVIALLPMARGGQIKALAITAAKRSTLAPDIPTAAESGMPGLEFASWYGVWGPHDLPNDIIHWLNATLNEATLDLASRGRLADLGIVPVVETPEEFARFIAVEVARGAELFRFANFKPV
jgi:tripartite-type tricarboxylate transporter receptor subunit TctC